MTVVCIAGMHRSGTSMVARMLHLCGLYLGEATDLIPASEDNPEGYWENIRFHAINEQLLSLLGGSWDAPPAFEPGWESSAALFALRHDAELAVRRMAGHPAWGWKDPRNSLTLPFWRGLIPDLKVVVCLRHPLETARSLSRRGYSSRLFALRLWRTYLRRLLDDAPETDRILTHYESYFYDAASELDRVLAFLGLPRNAHAVALAAATVQPGMRNARASLAELTGTEGSPEVRTFYSSLCARAGPVFQAARLSPEGWTPGPSRAPDAGRIAAAGEPSGALRPLQGRINGLEQKAWALESQLAGRDDTLRTLTNRLAEREETLRALTGQLEEKEQSIRLLSERAAEWERTAKSLADAAEEKGRAALALAAQSEEKDRAALALAAQSEEKDRAALALAAQSEEKDRALRELNNRLNLVQQTAERQFAELEEIRGGAAWKVYQALHKARAVLIPYGSRREKLWRASAGALKVWRVEGFAALLRKTRIGRASRTAVRRPDQAEDRFRRAYADRIRMLHQRNESLYVPISAEDFDSREASVKAVAFYHPDFYPSPETDELRGRGYTEWIDVSRAVPHFLGQYQPRLPGELGFYDLRLPEVLQRQVELAKKYGIHGFCFRMHESGGKRLLDLPLYQLLEHTEFTLPFCVCWADDGRVRRRSGARRGVRTAPAHIEDECGAFVRDLLPFFRDPRYIRVDGRPMLVVDRVDIPPNSRKAAEAMRAESRRQGIDGIYLVAVQAARAADPRSYGFDAAVEYPPRGLEKTRLDRSAVTVLDPHFSGTIHDYARAVEAAGNPDNADFPLFRTVMPSWDDTARNGSAAAAFIHSTPALYKEWLGRAAAHARRLPPDRRFVFCNAWNGWGDGAYLEPDRMYGYAYLQATAEALKAPRAPRSSSPSPWTILFVSHDAHQGGAQGILLDTVSWFIRHTPHRVVVLCLAGGGWLPRFEQLAETITLDGLRGGDAGLPEAVLLERLRAFCGGTPDLVYGNTVVAGREYAWLGKLGAPILTHILELEMSIRHYARAEWMADIARHSAGYIACSNAVKNNLVARHALPPDRIAVCYPGVHPDPAPRAEGDADRIRDLLGLERDKRLVFGCGLGMPFRKGADLFIELARLLRRKGVDGFHLYWIGALDDVRDDPQYGNWRDHLDRLAGDGLDAYVTFLGLKENPRAYMRAGDVFVLTSREEPFGLVALEAADCGLPVVCFDNAGAADFVGTDAGFAVPAEDAQAMADKLAALLADEDLRRRTGRRAREKVRAGFTVEQATRHVSAACRRTAGRKPAVSVIVPNYNHARWLPERLDSIFDQTFQDFEVILIDDASTDGSLEVLERYAGRGDVEIIRNERNSGSPFPQWLKGIARARADILWIAESDDRCAPEFLEALLPAFADPAVRLAYANSDIIDENGMVTGDYMDNPYLTSLSPTKWRADYCVPAEREVNDGFGVKDTILNASAVLFRRFEPEEDFRRTFAEMRTVGDWLFFARAMRGGSVRYDARKLNCHRRHAESVIGKILKEKKVERFFRDFSRVQQYIFDAFSLDAGFPGKWEAYLRQQWDDFFPGVPFEKLSAYYPVDDMRRRIRENRGDAGG